MIFKLDRVSRRKYVVFTLSFLIISLFILYLNDFDLDKFEKEYKKNICIKNIILLILNYILIIIFFWWLFLTLKRWHDINLSGWSLSIIIFLMGINTPLILILFLLFLMFKEGNPKINRFGPPPYDYWSLDNDSYNDFKFIINLIKNWD